MGVGGVAVRLFVISEWSGMLPFNDAFLLGAVSDMLPINTLVFNRWLFA